jgi:hypothetical protein
MYPNRRRSCSLYRVIESGVDILCLWKETTVQQSPAHVAQVWPFAGTSRLTFPSRERMHYPEGFFRIRSVSFFSRSSHRCVRTHFSSWVSWTLWRARRFTRRLFFRVKVDSLTFRDARHRRFGESKSITQPGQRSVKKKVGASQSWVFELSHFGHSPTRSCDTKWSRPSRS